MADLNSFSFTGRLTRDAAVKNINGKTLVELSVANNIGYGDYKKTNWLKVKWWGDRANNAAPIFTKGALVTSSGELSTESYENKEGKTIIELVVTVFGMRLLSKPKQESGPAPDYDEEDPIF